LPTRAMLLGPLRKTDRERVPSPPTNTIPESEFI
jgi:hypothetical protein